jgi:ADP-ribosylation factor GTPase-activating protein 2/3
VIVDVVPTIASDGGSTPAGESDDDFFSSWDKPSIKRPSNPPSRTATPGATSRTGSPFLNPGTNGNGTARPKSPLVDSEKSIPAPVAVRTGPAVRKANATGGAKKGGILGAKKTQKLGAKKVNADAIDFDEVEKKAKEEAERIEKLGYDPEAEKAEAEAKNKATSTSTSKIAAPTPISPGRASFGSTRSHERSASEVERLGMGMSRLGFGQVGSAPKAAPAPKKPGFGAIGQSKVVDGMSPFTMFSCICDSPWLIYPILADEELEYTRSKFGTQKGISSDEFFGRESFDPNAQAEAKSRLTNFEGQSSISSNAYFGRPEDDLPTPDEFGNYGDLEGAAKDFVRKFGITAGDDLENLSQVLGDGASMLQGKWPLVLPRRKLSLFPVIFIFPLHFAATDCLVIHQVLSATT